MAPWHFGQVRVLAVVMADHLRSSGPVDPAFNPYPAQRAVKLA
jgi:hypothetical protein